MNEMFLKTGNESLDALFPRIKEFFAMNAVDYNVMGKRTHGYRDPDAPSIWLRGVADSLRAYKYWEKDLKSIIEIFADTQTAAGWLYDYFTMTPEKVPCEKENWAKFVRVPNEADVEFRFVKAVYQVWQATGDDTWLRKMIPVMERALQYIVTDAWRWDKKTGLVKRSYTIDTWDFDYTADRHEWLNFQLDENTFWGIMHGDNSGYYEAFLLMSSMYKQVKNAKGANYWRAIASRLRAKANKVCFNGRFYTHHVPLVPVKIDGVDESEQLSLSNPMDINRGLPTHEMAASIIREYQRRAAKGTSFAEWFSIDPPFPAGVFGDDKIIEGAYSNGGIMPLVGGELARAALEHGFEKYGVDNLLRYAELTSGGESFLWYFPDGTHATLETSTSPDASPGDTWGSSAMLYALVEGLAGIVDAGKLYKTVSLSPRWEAAGTDEAAIRCTYEASGSSFEYSYAHDRAQKKIGLEIPGKSNVALHLLLPSGTRAESVKVNRKSVRFTRSRVEGSPYVDAALSIGKKAVIEVGYDS